MKVLLDSCVWGGVRKALLDAGHDVVWAGEKYGRELEAGTIITVEAARVRVRPPTDTA